MNSSVPIAFLDIEDWILHYIYHHPKDNHSTHSLLQQFDSVLKAEPSRLDEHNKHNRLFGSPAVTAEEYESLRKPELSAVQRAVETLIKEGWAKGKRGTDDQGVVFFSGLDLTGSGTKETIRRARAKEEKARVPRNFENTLRELRKLSEEETTKD